MKKLIFLFVLSLGFMSFSSNEIIENEKQISTCCTATLIINGEPGPSATAFVSGIGPETSKLACSLATSKLAQQLSISAN
ncbi:MAG: hypothetical protein WBF67_08350 [Olleya sp.]